MHFDAEESGRLILREGTGVLAEYVYEPGDAPVESPRPYALLRTWAGVDVTAYRPDDHVWHKGLSLALPVVGPHNFWGGPTYVHGDGYVQLANNGAQVHRAFVSGDNLLPDAVAGVARVDEDLDWIAEDGAHVLAERRTLTARPIDADTWALTWRSALRNVTDAPLGFGSPTSKGRENAGYAGIFWRGPVAFTGGDIVAPSGLAGDATRGEPGPWLAFIAPDRSAGVLMLDAGERESPWFARSAEYAGLNPAPFFFHETVLPPAETLVLASALIIGTDDVAAMASTVGATLVDELRAAHTPDPTEEPA